MRFGSSGVSQKRWPYIRKKYLSRDSPFIRFFYSLLGAWKDRTGFSSPLHGIILSIAIHGLPSRHSTVVRLLQCHGGCKPSIWAVDASP